MTTMKEKPMNITPMSIVRRALARHLSVPVHGVTPSDDLERDLGLKPLDLAIITLRLEADAGAWSEFPMARLEGVQSVAQLAEVVAGWIAEDAVARPRTADIHIR